jgi:6-phosphogluconate dehydrogenase
MTSRVNDHRGIFMSALSSVLNYYDTVRAQQLPANLLQAMRDYFGGHTFERTDMPGTYHDDWGDPASRP